MEGGHKDDPIRLLNKPSYKQVVVKMKAPYLNTLFKCCNYHQENAYKIYKWIPNDPKYDISNGRSGKRIMKFKERSSLTMRCFVPSACRGYMGQIQAETNRKVVFEMKRSCKCTICCFQRPEGNVFIVTDHEKKKNTAGLDEQELKRLNDPDNEARKMSHEYLGRVILPCSACGFRIEIFDAEEQPLYQIYGSAWQCQLCVAPLPFGPCEESRWIIADYHGTLDDQLGYIYKKWSNCYKQCLSTAPWYVIDFPNDTDWKKKVLIICSIQLLDQHYFEGMCK